MDDNKRKRSFDEEAVEGLADLNMKTTSMHLEVMFYAIYKFFKEKLS